MAAAKNGQLELILQWQQQQQASQAYLKLLQQVLTSLIQLVQDHMLGHQQVCASRSWSQHAPSVYCIYLLIAKHVKV